MVITPEQYNSVVNGLRTQLEVQQALYIEQLQLTHALEHQLTDNSTQLLNCSVQNGMLHEELQKLRNSQMKTCIVTVAQSPTPAPAPAQQLTGSQPTPENKAELEPEATELPAIQAQPKRRRKMRRRRHWAHRLSK